MNLTEHDIVLAYSLYHSNSDNYELAEKGYIASLKSSNKPLRELYNHFRFNEADIAEWDKMTHEQRKHFIISAIGSQDFITVIGSSDVVSKYSDASKLSWIDSAHYILNGRLYPSKKDAVNAATKVMNDGCRLIKGEFVVIENNQFKDALFLTIRHAKVYLKNLKVRYVENDKEKVCDAFEIWLDSPMRKTYSDLDFNPNDNSDSNKYNLWRGFSRDPVTPTDSIDLILEFIKEVICDSNEESFHYLMSWIAHLIQKPGEKPGVAVVLRSTDKGTGKTTFTKILEKLLGVYFVRTQSSEQV